MELEAIDRKSVLMLTINTELKMNNSRPLGWTPM